MRTSVQPHRYNFTQMRPASTLMLSLFISLPSQTLSTHLQVQIINITNLPASYSPSPPAGSGGNRHRRSLSASSSGGSGGVSVVAGVTAPSAASLTAASQSFVTAVDGGL